MEVLDVSRRIGFMKNGKKVTISPTANNYHVAILGMSGSGKSTRIKENVVDLIKNGETVLFFDLEGTEHNYPEDMLNHIDLQDDGLNLKLLDLKYVEAGKESHVNFIAHISELLSGTQNLGSRQLGILRDAIEYAVKHNNEYFTDMDAIADGLILTETSSATGVYNKLWPVLRSNVFRDNGKDIVKGKINVISLEKLTDSSQKVLVEMILGSIWREALKIGPEKIHLSLILDEFQRYEYKRSVLKPLFTQGLKYGINIIVATQSSSFLTSEIRGAVNQAATRLFFKPANGEEKKVAELISGHEVERYTLMLKKLKVGECLVVGNTCIDGVECDTPVVTQSLMSLQKKEMYSEMKKLAEMNHE